MPPELTPRQREVLDFIHDFIRDRGFSPSQAEIAEALGLRSPNAVAQHVRLMVKKGALEHTPGVSRSLRPRETPEPPEAPGLPLVGEVAAGAPILAEENVEAHLPLSPGLFRSPPDYLLRVRGESMIEAGIRPGDLVAVQRRAMVSEGDIAVVRLNDEVTLKRWTTRGGQVALLPENHSMSPIIVDPSRESVVVEGSVMGLIRLEMEGFSS